MEGERRLTRTGGIWILLTPFINQPSAHLDQIYALSGALVIGDGPLQPFLEVCVVVYVLVHTVYKYIYIYSLCVSVCMH